MNYTLALFLISLQSLIAAPGCMDNSYHVDRCAGYDYKNYHQVTCLCPCERYPHLFERGTCRKCWHYRVPSPLVSGKPRKK